MSKFGLGSGLGDALKNVSQTGEDLARGVKVTTDTVTQGFKKATNLFDNPTNVLGSGFNIAGVGEDIKNASKVLPGLKEPALLGKDGNNLLDGKQANGAKDLRVRLRAMTGQDSQVYGPREKDISKNILSPLYDTNGMLYPFTPAIDWAQQVEYTATSLIHSNQDYYTYKNTPSTKISVTGDFVIQNYKEGVYMLAVIHFLRTVSKMYFGKSSFAEPGEKKPGFSGMPPPVLLFSGYGDYMFNDLPVIVQDHRYAFKPDVSYVDVKVGDSVTRLPTVLSVSLSLVVQNTPKKHREEFNLDKFRTGELMKKKGWI